MLVIVGTVPDPQLPLVAGPATLADGQLQVGGRRFAVHRGTPALLAAAVRAAQCLPDILVYAFLVGDIGKGQGSRLLYAHLAEHLSGLSCRVLTFHYLQPDVDWHARVLWAAEAMTPRPLLIADAGFMYAAKMSGLAAHYDFFTPDAGELAFLADEQAPHPFYTRGFLLHEADQAPDLIHRACQHGNAARYLLVKGATDLVARDGQVLRRISSPSFPAMEAIGGTGDSLTGLLSAICCAGIEPQAAATMAAQCNRCCGDIAGLSPATQIASLIERIPAVLPVMLAGEKSF